LTAIWRLLLLSDFSIKKRVWETR